MVVKKPGVEKISVSARPAGVRVELTLPGPVQANVFKLKKFQDKPYRIVIDLILQDAAKKESEAREKIKVASKARIVVIDPGHGGEAPGAVGKRGTFEKYVVLAIAKKVRDLINSREGYHAFLTRNDDYYVSFNKRLTIARECGADLFVSIHADAAKNRQASGSSVYCLSTGAASSEAAKILAKNENLADIVGGVPNGEGNDASDPIILDMFQTHNINQSRTLGELMLRELGSATRLKFTTVQEAPFRVLKLPEIPSILVETAYISNVQEEKLLQSDRFQSRIAEGLTRSIVQFLPPLPQVSGAVSTGTEEESKTQVVSAGEEKGAAKRQVATKKPLAAPVSKAGKIIYRVKKGDTLASIAAKHGTTVRVLMELNEFHRPDLLYVDRKVVLPGPPYR
jgi:N-acetylmuramoyl-L-alanine amidase